MHERASTQTHAGEIQAGACGLDADWTLCPEGSAKELRFGAQRNEMVKQQLQLGKPVTY